MSENEPKVLISYTHDSKKHKDRILNPTDKLRDDGIDCRIDQYEDSPPEGRASIGLNKSHQLKRHLQSKMPLVYLELICKLLC